MSDGRARPVGPLVGKAGFEPATPCSQSRCAAKLRHFPEVTTIRGRSASPLRESPQVRALFSRTRAEPVDRQGDFWRRRGPHHAPILARPRRERGLHHCVLTVVGPVLAGCTPTRHRPRRRRHHRRTRRGGDRLADPVGVGRRSERRLRRRRGLGRVLDHARHRLEPHPGQRPDDVEVEPRHRPGRAGRDGPPHPDHRHRRVQPAVGAPVRLSVRRAALLPAERGRLRTLPRRGGRSATARGRPTCACAARSRSGRCGTSRTTGRTRCPSPIRTSTRRW